MPRPAGQPTSAVANQGLLGCYALAMMEREGPIYGYRVAERIAERTEGSWRPGPGAVYPSLQKLVARGWAHRRTQGRRQEYAITAQGRKFLAQIRERQSSIASGRMDLTILWADVAGSEDVDSFLLLRLRRAVDAISYRLERTGPASRSTRDLRTDVLKELAQALARLERATLPVVPLVPRRRLEAR